MLRHITSFDMKQYVFYRKKSRGHLRHVLQFLQCILYDNQTTLVENFLSHCCRLYFYDKSRLVGSTRQ